MYLSLELCTEISVRFRLEMEEAKVAQQMLPGALKGGFKTSLRTYVKEGMKDSQLVLYTHTDINRPINF